MGDVVEELAFGFSTTKWTVLEGLRADDEAMRRSAAEKLASTYWPPVYALARSLVRTREEAADLTQGFFAEVVLGRGLFERADRERGSLRALLCASLRRYAVDRWRHAQSRGHDHAVRLEGLDREDALCVAVDGDATFDRRWALALFEETLRRCEKHFVRTGKSGHWRVFELRVLGPVTRGTVPLSCADAARMCGFESAADAAAAVQTVKRRLDVVLREVVGETLDSPEDFPEEFEIVCSLLRGG